MRLILVIILIIVSFTAKAQTITVHGIVYDSDSITTLPYSYVVNKNTRLGLVTDQNGQFNITANKNDTLLISYISKLPEKIILSNFKVDNGYLYLKIYLKSKPEQLKQVVIRSVEFSKEQRKNYEKYIYKPLNNTPINSPITFMYDRFSKEARSREKLRSFYEQDLLEDMARKRLTNEIIIKLTGNPAMTYDKLRQLCQLSPAYIVTALEYDLYLQIKKCYNYR